MGTRYVKADIANEASGPGIALSSSSAGLTDAYIYAGVSVTASLGDGIFGAVSGHDVNVAGFVSGDTNGIRLGDNRAIDNHERIVVYANGVVNASNGAAVSITAYGSTLENAGDIQGGTIGVMMSGVSATTQSLIRNTGSIHAGDYGFARSLTGGDTETILFRNSGYVTANLFAYRGGDTNVAIDHIVNTGVFDGDVALGGGADIYDASGGGTVLGVVFGESGADTFIGNSGLRETFDGGADADIFTSDRSGSAGGSDIFRGGAGADTYFVFTGSGDTIIESAAGGPGGVDLVVSTNSFSIEAIANVEYLTLADVAGAVAATGNSLNNTLRGNSLGNSIDGKGGGDLMIGGKGGDTYTVDSLQDRVSELVDQGSDSVNSSVSFVLPTNVETLDLSGTANINGTGNTLDNFILCNNGNNTINGLLGNDDIQLGGGGAYRVVFSTALGPNNIDDVSAFFTTDTIVLDNAIFTALSNGALPAGAFHEFPAFPVPAQSSLDADDRIISLFDGSNHTLLFYDPDGSGSAAMVQFAELFSSQQVSASNFQVI